MVKSPCNLEENSFRTDRVPRQVWAVNMTQVEGPKRGGGSGSELAGGKESSQEGAVSPFLGGHRIFVGNFA